MASGIDFSSLDEVSKKINDAIKEVPDLKRKMHTNAADIMHKNVINNISNDTKPLTGNLKRGQVKAVGSRGGYAAVRPDYGIAPHTHLIENGHKIVKGGKVVGFANGKHMYKKALNASQRQIEVAVEKFANDVTKGF